jgi:hypothetical protein
MKVWLCETMLQGSWDEDVWKRDVVKAECQRREKSEIFQRAEERIFRQTRKRRDS